MSININSTQISALLQLYPMAIPGAVENLQPPGAYHLGIPESIHSPSTKLFMVIDPVTLFSTSFAAGDSVRLWVNSQSTSVIKPVKPGEENDRIFMELPWGGLKDGLNTLYYEVTRVSGNKDQSTPILNVLFNNPASGITVSHPASIGPGQPATFTLTRSNPREYDVMELFIGRWTKIIPYVHPANPVTYTLTATDLQQIGDGTHQVYARVVDQLSNLNVSPTTSIVITANTLVLPPPTVKGQTGNNFDSTLQNIEVLVPAGTLLPTDEIYVKWEGAISTPAASFTSPQRLVSAGLTFVVPRSVLAYSLGKSVKVTYVIKRNGVTTSSQVLPLNILPLPATALISPKILQANANNVLDVTALGTQNATIHALLFTLIADGMPCWLSLEGKKADGTAHNLALWNGLPARVNPTWVSQGFWPEALVNSYLKQLGNGTSLIIKFAVSMNMSNVRATAVEFPDRVYTIKAEALVNATITRVNENTATGALVPNGESTTATTLVISGTAAAGEQVEVRNHNALLDTVRANSQGVFSYTHVDATLGARSYTAIGLYGMQPVSPAYVLTVRAASVPTITSVKLANGIEILPGGRTVETTLTLSGTSELEVEIFDGAITKGKATPSGGIWTRQVTGLGVGVRTFTAQVVNGGHPVSQPRTVEVVRAPVLVVDTSNLTLTEKDIVVDKPQLIGWVRKPGTPLKPTAQRMATGGLSPYAYRSTDTTVATVDSNGVVRGVSAGTAQIIITDGAAQQVAYTVKKIDAVSDLIVTPQALKFVEFQTWRSAFPAPIAPIEEIVDQLNQLYTRNPPGGPNTFYWTHTVIKTSPKRYVENLSFWTLNPGAFMRYEFQDFSSAGITKLGIAIIPR